MQSTEVGVLIFSQILKHNFQVLFDICPNSKTRLLHYLKGKKIISLQFPWHRRFADTEPYISILPETETDKKQDKSKQIQLVTKLIDVVVQFLL